MKLKAMIRGGRVHEVGYRVFLLQKAIELGGGRFSAHNRFENGSQLLVAFIEGEQKLIEEFREFVKCSKPEDATVAELSFEDYNGHVMSIEDFMHFSQVEQLNKGIPALLRIDKKQDRMLEKQDSMLEMQEQMVEGLEKIQVDVVGEIKASRDAIIDELGGEIRDSSEAVIHGLKENAQSLGDIRAAIGEQRLTLNDRLDRIESDISKLKAKVKL
jgi:acylphosphatase